MAMLPPFSQRQALGWHLQFWPRPNENLIGEMRAQGAMKGQSPGTRDCPFSEGGVLIGPQRGFPVQQSQGKGKEGPGDLLSCGRGQSSQGLSGSTSTFH